MKYCSLFEQSEAKRSLSLRSNTSLSEGVFSSVSVLVFPLGNVSLKKALPKKCFFLVPVTGVEPVRYRYHWILSPARLPIPSHRHMQVIILYIFNYFKYYFEKFYFILILPNCYLCFDCINK